MSMLSAQCDELRAMAESVGLAVPQAATLMMEAADTIDRLDAENAKLRELAQRADRLLTGLFPYIDYSRCTALEAVAAWRVRARELGVEVDE